MSAVADSVGGVYGLVAVFDSSDDLLAATEKAYENGYRRMDAYSPFPIHGLSEALRQPFTKLPWFVFAAGVIGCLSAFALQTWTSAIDYPLNVGGRPLFSWPAFIPVTFEVTILFAALATVGGIIVFNGLPRPHHAIFNAPGFDRATTDRFFLCIEADDEQFDMHKTKSFLQSLGAQEVESVAR